MQVKYKTKAQIYQHQLPLYLERGIGILDLEQLHWI
jgi:hypothetical protein